MPSTIPNVMKRYGKYWCLRILLISIFTQNRITSSGTRSEWFVPSTDPNTEGVSAGHL